MARQRTVLLVARAGLTRTVTAAGLTIYGYNVLTAEYADTPETLGSGCHIDVVVIDLDLADDGQRSAIARSVQRLNPRVDIVYTSRMPSRAAAGLRGSGAPILRDPYRPHQLADVIAHLRYRSAEASDASVA
jgi:DNA-binding NtrC family response regulator